MNIAGKHGVSVREKWKAGPKTYLGVATAGFPNMFMVTGPGSPSVLSNMITSIEQHVEWITDAIKHLENHDLVSIEATQDAEDTWVEHVNEVANMTLHHRANSWYLGANIPGKPRVLMPYVGGVGNYRKKCDDVAAKDYEGFVVSA
jgi:cyclohexanone monooxygenase